MLAGLFKTFEESGCLCHALQVVDRIWIDDSGNASVIREVIVQVDDSSPIGLSRIRTLIPASRLETVKDLSETLCDPEFHLNHRGRQDTYALVTPPARVNSVAGLDVLEAVINQYEWSDIRVFAPVRTEHDAFMDATMMEWSFPAKVDPGQRVMVRSSFVVADQLLGDGVADCRHLRLRYFSQRECPRALAQVDFDRTGIDVLLQYAGKTCGMDVAVFFPPTLHVNSPNPGTFDRRTDRTGFGGVGKPFYIRYLWHARDFYTTPLESVKTPISIDCSEISPPDSTARDVQELHTVVSDFVGSFSRSVGALDDRLKLLRVSARRSTVLSVIGVVISLVAVGLALLFYALDHPVRTTGASTSAPASSVPATQSGR